MPDYHLAQINIARILAPIDDRVMAGFVVQLPPVNAQAERSPGFVWRLQSENGDATSLRVYDDEMIIISISRKLKDISIFGLLLTVSRSTEYQFDGVGKHGTVARVRI